MDRIWDTSKYPHKLIMTLCQSKVIQGHEEKVKIKMLGSVGVMQAPKSDFRQERKKWHQNIFWRAQMRQNLKIEKCQNPYK